MLWICSAHVEAWCEELTSCIPSVFVWGGFRVVCGWLGGCKADRRPKKEKKEKNKMR